MTELVPGIHLIDGVNAHPYLIIAGNGEPILAGASGMVREGRYQGRIPQRTIKRARRTILSTQEASPSSL